MGLGPNRELERLWARPLLQGIFSGRLSVMADGPSIEDVLLELYQFGDVRLLSVHTDRALEGRRWPNYRCIVTLRGENRGDASGTGQTAQASALRCLLECLEEFDRLADHVMQGVEAFMYGQTADLDAETQLGIERLIEFLREHDGLDEQS